MPTHHKLMLCHSSNTRVSSTQQYAVATPQVPCRWSNYSRSMIVLKAFCNAVLQLQRIVVAPIAQTAVTALVWCAVTVPERSDNM
jgi:hypothetical protein